MNKVKTKKVYVCETEYGEFELPAEPVSYLAEKIIVKACDDGGFKVAYPVDGFVDGESYFDQYDGLRFFNTRRDRQAIDELDENWSIFGVDKYEHSSVAFALAGSFSCPWDTTRGVYALAVSNDFSEPELTARQVLEEYTSWCNGDVFSVVVAEYDKDRRFIDHDIYGNAFGSKQLDQLLAEVSP